jgi:hypothetical protein
MKLQSKLLNARYCPRQVKQGKRFLYLRWWVLLGDFATIGRFLPRSLRSWKASVAKPIPIPKGRTAGSATADATGPSPAYLAGDNSLLGQTNAANILAATGTEGRTLRLG